MNPSFQPSLKALRSFEAAARLESLTLAARELNVSVSAVAFQVRQVEAGLGQKLLTRNGRALAATETGKSLARELQAAFARIDASLASFLSNASQTVTVTMLPNFAALWLLPRLAGFRALHPEIDVQILTTERLVKLDAERVDCAIRCGPGHWQGLRAELLFSQQLAPVCRPDHPSTGRPLGELAPESMIVNSRQPPEWSIWSKATGSKVPDLRRSQSLDGRELVAEAVFAGLGVGLMDVSIFASQIRNGRLHQLGPAIPTGWSHYFVTPEQASGSLARQAFRDWLMAEAHDAVGEPIGAFEEDERDRDHATPLL
ncbi:LysR substrate-binding domain-containing protein [Sphingomonas sp.]|jgi:DNA-binding transcriptional LysR family regulator|uniref:LysR substrate-binding domain-containing protein n=1 Tax=Sphingomonas sp. TaxID=28214 RepID=UPI002DE8F705|nr:LysR substrate-binding domain-containing protein [Sphingomonas sp.]